MSALPYMTHWIADLEAETVNLSFDAAAVHRVLGEKYWLADLDLKWLGDEMHLLVRCPLERFKAAWDELCNAGVWSLTVQGQLCNKRLAQVFAQSLHSKEVASERGKKGSDARWLGHTPKNKSPDCATVQNAQAMPSITNKERSNDLSCATRVAHEREREVPKSKRRPEVPTTGTPSPFERWYAAYPVHRNRYRARVYWDAKGLDARADELIADVQRRKAQDRHWREGYAAHPAKYLHDELWHDDIAPPREPKQRELPVHGEVGGAGSGSVSAEDSQHPSVIAARRAEQQRAAAGAR